MPTASGTRRKARIYPRMVEQKLLKLGAEQAQAEVNAGRVPAWLKPMVNASTSKAIREREASLVIQNSVRNAIANGTFARARERRMPPTMEEGNSAHEPSARGRRVRKATRKARRGGIKETRSATRRRLKRMGENSASKSK